MITFNVEKIFFLKMCFTTDIADTSRHVLQNHHMLTIGCNQYQTLEALECKIPLKVSSVLLYEIECGTEIVSQVLLGDDFSFALLDAPSKI